MTPLRQKMIDLMHFRQFSPKTHQAYLGAVTRLSTYYHCSPEHLSSDEVKKWLMITAKDRNWSASTVHQSMMGLKFFYHQVLQQTDFLVAIALPKKPKRIPGLLTQKEVYRLLHGIDNLKHLTMMSVCYGCGLRVSELVALMPGQIDAERLLIQVVQGKNKKDRSVPLSDSVLTLLRHYWQMYQPKDYLFGHRAGRALDASTAQRVYTRAKTKAGIDKPGGIHSLRHAYATHQLEHGLPIHQLQQFLGHSDISTTMRYVHWLPSSDVKASDLLGGFSANETLMKTQREVLGEHF